MTATKLYLVTPFFADRVDFLSCLDRVLSKAPVAAVLMAPSAENISTDTYLQDCKVMAPVIQEHGAAALILDVSEYAAPLIGDGVHITKDTSALREAKKRFQPDRIVGAGAITDRHNAMTKGELEPDYILFGDPLNVETEAEQQKARELARWWATLFEIPCVVMAGTTQKSLQAAIATKAEFIGLNHLVWSHAQGPEVAINYVHEYIEQQV